jgi:hypothetical protein
MFVWKAAPVCHFPVNYFAEMYTIVWKPIDRTLIPSLRLLIPGLDPRVESTTPEFYLSPFLHSCQPVTPNQTVFPISLWASVREVSTTYDIDETLSIIFEFGYPSFVYRELLHAGPSLLGLLSADSESIFQASTMSW